MKGTRTWPIIIIQRRSKHQAFCGMIDGLSFLPEDDVHAGMMYLKDNVPAEVEPLLGYLMPLMCLAHIDPFGGHIV